MSLNKQVDKQVRYDLSYVDVRNLSIKCYGEIQEEKDDSGIVAISSGNTLLVGIGDQILYQKSAANKLAYTINYITYIGKGYGFKQYMLCIDPVNSSSYFMLPMVGKNRQSMLFNTHLINAYTEIDESILDMLEINLYDDYYIYLLTKFGNGPYLDFEQALSNDENFIYSGVTLTSHNELHIFKVPEARREDYRRFKESNYSLISEDYKRQILTFHSFGKESILAKVLYKDKQRRYEIEEELGVTLDEDAELWEAYDAYKERLHPGLLFVKEASI